MESIKYHQNGIGNEYGADHALTNNWNPEVDYGNEYVNIYFRIEAPGYSYPSFSFTEEGEKAFYIETKNALQPLGWESEIDAEDWHCGYIKKGKQHLYLHPQNFSGEILKNEVKQIAEALQKHDTFYLRWVDLYETVYDISDTEYEEYLVNKDEEIRKILFEQCQTKRTNKYFYVFDVCRNLAEKIRLRRVGLNDGRNSGSGQTIEHIKEIIDKMIIEGLLVSVEINGNKCVRSLNKTEQKKLKLMIA
ncbi:hypothetical protein [Acetobacterium wieringae]|uniref:hypothetical protein n=1 Tax=Acetobacterium wieringae TaxID=52694 RepID=UPI0026EDFB2B|nr:hypothetical protein [Acetobacterium wieringae]